jgi:hypothetical protein
VPARTDPDVELVEHIYPAAGQLGFDISLGAMAPTHDERTAIEELLSSPSEALIGTTGPPR